MAHILIADDDPIIADLLARILARHGHTTSVAGDGLAALCYLEQGLCDLLITDLEMPRFAGAALVRLLAARPQRPRILVTSGSAIDPRTRAIADGFLAKPFGLREVVAAVASALSASALASRASASSVAAYA